MNPQPPLPWQEPKPALDDPLAAERVRAILAGASYRLAQEDPALLERPDLRGMRLQLDYYKTELLLQDHGVEHTIVVFGGTRIAEPAAAQRALQTLQARAPAAGAPAREREQHARELAVAQRLADRSRYYGIARELGRCIARAGGGPADTRVMVITGGGPGIMEAANRGAFDEGAKSIGLNIDLPHEQYPNPYVTPELCLRFHYFALRKLHFMLRARALVAFPGGYGTLDELFETLTLVQTRKIDPVPVVLVGREFWERAIDFDFLVAEGVIAPQDLELFHYCEQAREAWDWIVHWHRERGRPLYPEPLPARAP